MQIYNLFDWPYRLDISWKNQEGHALKIWLGDIIMEIQRKEVKWIREHGRILRADFPKLWELAWESVIY